MAVKITKITGVDQAKGIIARGSNAGAFVRIKDKQSLKIRFMGEPGSEGIWVQFSEHYDSVNNFYPCSDDGTCPGCADGVKKSKRFLVQAVDMAEKTVVAIVLPMTLAEELLQKYDKFTTLCDRTYEISRTGSGLNDTRYSVDYGETKRLDLSRFEPLDLVDLLNTQLPVSDAVVDDDEELVPRARPAKRTAPAARRSTVDDDLDDDDFAPAPKQGGTVRPIAKKTATPPVKKMLRRPGA